MLAAPTPSFEEQGLALCAALGQCADLSAFRSALVEGLGALLQADCGALYGSDFTQRQFLSLASWNLSSELPSFQMDRGTGPGSALFGLMQQGVPLTDDASQARSLQIVKPLIFGSSHQPVIAIPIHDRQDQTISFLGLYALGPDAQATLPDFDRPAYHTLIQCLCQIGVQMLVRHLEAADKEHLTLSLSSERANNTVLRTAAPGAIGMGIVGKSEAIEHVRNQILRAAPSPLSVLIRGETGSGKELVARYLHEVSGRSDKPFIAENVSALPEQLVESELFGHEKGAFTGALTERKGLVREVNGGTLFLDEIGDMPASAQVKLLRVLQERKVRPIGSQKEHDVSFRLVAATHQDLEALVRDGQFREDLYFRLKDLTITMPPLRVRLDDIEPLAEHFLREIAARDNQRKKSLSEPALEQLKAHPFPGNVRQLRSVIERSALMAGTMTTIDVSILADVLHEEPIHFGGSAQGADSSYETLIEASLAEGGLKATTEAVEKAVLQKSHLAFLGDRRKMAGHLRIPVRTLSDKIRRYQIC